jgi:DNA invertase Pin-like site-specific DNA recombinase
MEAIMSKRAVLYARVAVGDADGASRELWEQLDQCRDYALAQDWTVIAELHEDERGVSGLALDPPQLATVRRMAQAQEFDVLIVRDLSRISRNVTTYLTVEQELQRVGIQIACVTGGQTRTIMTKAGACPFCREKQDE